MLTTFKLAGMAAALAGALVGFGLLGAGESTHAFAAPVAAASPAAAADETARPAAEKRDCAKQAWPYLAPECLAAAAGTPVRRVSRIIALAPR